MISPLLFRLLYVLSPLTSPFTFPLSVAPVGGPAWNAGGPRALGAVYSGSGSAPGGLPAPVGRRGGGDAGRRGGTRVRRGAGRGNLWSKTCNITIIHFSRSPFCSLRKRCTQTRLLAASFPHRTYESRTLAVDLPICFKTIHPFVALHILCSDFLPPVVPRHFEQD